jgi:hypothetical protein
MKTVTLKNFISKATKGMAVIDFENKTSSNGLNYYRGEFELGLIGDVLWFTTEGEVRYSGKTEKQIVSEFEEFKREQTK